MVAAGIADEMLVQLSYAIGVAEPISIFVDTYGRSHVNMSDGEIARKVGEIFDLRPRAIEQRLKLRYPIYEETASYGHVGREPIKVTKIFHSPYDGDKSMVVELFTWEKLDYVDTIKEAFKVRSSKFPHYIRPAVGFWPAAWRIYFTRRAQQRLTV